MLNPISHWDMFSREMRWTPKDAERTADGVDVRTLELSLSDRTGISVAADPEAIAYLHDWKSGKGFERLSKRLIASSAAVALINMPDLTAMNAIRGGQAVQRLWLKATQLDISVQPISAPIFLGIHERFDRTEMYSSSERSELATIYAKLVKTFGANKGEALFMLRMDHADPPTARSLRRPISEFFHVHQPIHA